jgi:hypothetical protein
MDRLAVFDLEHDPFEMENLALDPGRSAEMEDLRRQFNLNTTS